MVVQYPAREKKLAISGVVSAVHVRVISTTFAYRQTNGDTRRYNGDIWIRLFCHQDWPHDKLMNMLHPTDRSMKIYSSRSFLITSEPSPSSARVRSAIHIPQCQTSASSQSAWMSQRFTIGWLA